MTVDLTPEELDTLLTSIDYSKMHVRDAKDAVHIVRKETLERLDAVATKLRQAKNA